jgi:hypothetical protein
MEKKMSSDNMLSILDWFLANNPNLVINAKAVHQRKSFGQELLHLFPVNKEIKQQATFEEVIKWFSENSDNYQIKKGIVIRKTEGKIILIIQVFLDDNDQVVRDANGQPLGRKFIVKTLDDELRDVFGNSNVIIVE